MPHEPPPEEEAPGTPSSVEDEEPEIEASAETPTEEQPEEEEPDETDS